MQRTPLLSTDFGRSVYASAPFKYDIQRNTSVSMSEIEPPFNYPEMASVPAPPAHANSACSANLATEVADGSIPQALELAVSGTTKWTAEIGSVSMCQTTTIRLISSSSSTLTKEYSDGSDPNTLPIRVYLHIFTRPDMNGDACPSAVPSDDCQHIIKRLPLHWEPDPSGESVLTAMFVPDPSSLFYALELRVRQLEHEV